MEIFKHLIFSSILLVLAVSGCTSLVDNLPSEYPIDEGFVEIGLKYDRIWENSITDVDGKLAYIAGTECSSGVKYGPSCKNNSIILDGKPYKTDISNNVG